MTSEPLLSTGPAWANPKMQPIQVTTEVVVMDPGQNALMEPSVSTLDEPVIDTIMRDLRAVGSKLRVVLLPWDRNAPFGYAGVAQGSENMELRENERLALQRLRDWDLWGPLIVCLTLSVLLGFKAPPDHFSLIFAVVFVAVWMGSSVVTINTQLLGGTISFFQSLCVMGYCVFPVTVATFVIGLLRLLYINFWPLDVIVCVIGFVWALRATTVFIGCYIKPERRFLAVYPVFFFYAFWAWVIMLFYSRIPISITFGPL